MATGKKKLADLEDEILRLLSESTGSLLDDMNLVNTLQDSKTISEEVTQQLQVRRLFLCDLKPLDHMYVLRMLVFTRKEWFGALKTEL